MEPNIDNNNSNNSNNIDNNNNNNNNLLPPPPLFPVLNINTPPQYFVQLDSILKIGECVTFEVDDCSKFGWIINYESDNNNNNKNNNKVIINRYIIPQEGS
jgi:hypothetical protein